MVAKTTLCSIRETGDSLYKSFALEIVPGAKCQMRCEYCYKRVLVQVPVAGGDMPLAFAKDALLQAKACGFCEAVFIGGEPTLHDDLPEMMAYASEIELKPILCTNGIKLADADYANSVAIDGAVLFMHGPLPAEVLDKQAHRKGYRRELDMAYQNVIGRTGVTVAAEAVVIQDYLEFIPEMYQWCLENDVKPFIEINRRADIGRVYSGTVAPEGVEALFEKLALMTPAEMRPDVLVPPMFAMPCTMAITGMHVKNFGGGDFGGVYSCCAQKVKHGDLRTQRLVEILADPGLVVFKQQDEWIYGPCRSCPIYSVCRAGCRGEATLAFGCARASSPICWHIPAEIRNDPLHMVPPSCSGCPLEGNPACHPRR